MEIKVKIHEILEKHDITLSEMSERTGIRRAALSELLNGKRERIQFEHIIKIAETFDIKDIREIIDFE